MRLLPVAAIVLLLAGCTAPSATISPPAGEPVTPESYHADAPAAPAPLRALAASLTLSTASGRHAWAAPGDDITLGASVPGAVAYVWAVGAVPGTAPVQPWLPDTGSRSAAAFLQPGQSSSLRFAGAGAWELACAAHPFLLSNVTVVDGYRGPAHVDVDITDDAFVPENVTIAPGTVVTWHNVGTMPHSATARTQAPPLKLLPIAAASGIVKADGAGWQRYYVLARDSSGASGAAWRDVYVGPIPSFARMTLPIDYALSGLPAGNDAPTTAKLSTAYNGTLFLNYTVADASSAASGGATPNTALVTVKLASGSMVALASENKSADRATLRVGASDGAPQAWTLVVTPMQGAKATGTLTVEVAYDVDPPTP